MGATVALAGCDAGEVAEKATGFEVLAVHQTYVRRWRAPRPKISFPNTTTARTSIGFAAFRIASGERGCRASVKVTKTSFAGDRYWVSIPGTGAGFVDCDLLRREGIVSG